MDFLAGDIKIDLPPDEYSDPNVRVVGGAEAVRTASMLVRQALEPQNKVTMKLDVPWTYHSHIIGKGGNTIQPVVKRTGVSVHFPDGNKSSEMHKSNQVSVNSRGEDLWGLEEARAAIRNLTPLVFSFSLSAAAQFIKLSDPNMLIHHVQDTFNVQVDLKLTKEPSPLILGTVRGNEWDASRVKEATHCLLQAYCNNLATQMPVQMTVEISPRHHTFVLGHNNETVKKIMQKTSTKITFPDNNNPVVPLLQKSKITITGAIDSVYLARQNIIGSLPLVVMFEVCGEGPHLEASEVSQVMQALDVVIVLKPRRLDGRRLVVVKGAERNADNIYEAWRLLTRTEKAPPKAHIPSTYHIPETNSVYGLSCEMSVVPWLKNTGCSNSGGSSPTPTPTPTPTSQLLWGGLNPSSSSSSTASLFPMSSSSHLLPHHPHQHLTCSNQCSTNIFPELTSSSNCHTSGLLRSGNLGYNTINNNNFANNNNHNNLTNYNNIGKSGGNTHLSGLNLGVIVSGLNGMTLSTEVEGMSTHPNSSDSDGSPSLSSPSSPSPLDPPSSPDRLLGTHIASTTSSTQYPHQDPINSHTGMNAISALLQDIDRRAVGCEKKRIQKMTTLSDYSSKKVQAARAMKEQVDASPRTPTSSWSGYGFSKSMPGFMLRQQKLQHSRLAQKAGLDDWDGWPRQEQQEDTTTTSQDFTTSCQPPLQYSQIAQLESGLRSEDGGLSQLSTPRPLVSLSASNFMDCLLPRSHGPSPHPNSHLDLTSVLSDLQLEQYIDMFAAHEVDLNMFLTLDDADLKELGIKIFGHRKRILMVIKDMSKKLMPLNSVTEGSLIGFPSSTVTPPTTSSIGSISTSNIMREATTTNNCTWN
ncbi:hypothetical protein Pcinc_020727 [Petrolisthes cinctipes]|uniref:SAM domain-containing protein n=1 Tax=Petrolisthes cinctipes TaxID=88211 RepID=A0AAE1FIW4_PETCI|nr:hypothetical protein Pcinc_020727 [Petrolisthes cinctipes]